MKAITKIALVALIVGFPLASWYYLTIGLNYRKQALADLKPKGEWIMNGVDQLDVADRVSVVFSGEELRDDMQLIYNQYKSNPLFQIVELAQDTTSNSPWKKVLFNNQSLKDSVTTTIFLLDQKRQLRRSYGTERKDLGQLVEHIAVVLPRDPELDIKMKPQNEGK